MDDLSTPPILESIRVEDQRQRWARPAPRRAERTPRERKDEPEAEEEDVPVESRDAKHQVDVSV
jgi:hypothetical protein